MSPTGQGVDHRQVQRELGEVAVQLQDPVTLTTASIRVSWTVSGSFLSFVSFMEGAFGELYANLSSFYLIQPISPTILQG